MKKTLKELLNYKTRLIIAIGKLIYYYYYYYYNYLDTPKMRIVKNYKLLFFQAFNLFADLKYFFF